MVNVNKMMISFSLLALFSIAHSMEMPYATETIPTHAQRESNKKAIIDSLISFQKSLLPHEVEAKDTIEMVLQLLNANFSPGMLERAYDKLETVKNRQMSYLGQKSTVGPMLIQEIQMLIREEQQRLSGVNQAQQESKHLHYHEKFFNNLLSVLDQKQSIIDAIKNALKTDPRKVKEDKKEAFQQEINETLEALRIVAGTSEKLRKIYEQKNQHFYFEMAIIKRVINGMKYNAKEKMIREREEATFFVKNNAHKPLIVRIRCGEENNIAVIAVDGENVNAETITMNPGDRIGIYFGTITGFPLRLRIFNEAPANLDIEKVDNPTQEQRDYYKQIGLSQSQTFTQEDKKTVLSLRGLNLAMFKSTKTSYENEERTNIAWKFDIAEIKQQLAEKQELSLVDEGGKVKGYYVPKPSNSHENNYKNTYHMHYA